MKCGRPGGDGGGAGVVPYGAGLLDMKLGWTGAATCLVCCATGQCGGGIVAQVAEELGVSGYRRGGSRYCAGVRF